ncbi:hypothetical protein [Halorientalis litorea]|uniref:hypothetical protein n=1 Tax=Halorientalis litorea TaxID=2931977 RepID=UPI001FF0FC70|nr:hypothetical protein [Halorientalis litorea]
MSSQSLPAWLRDETIVLGVAALLALAPAYLLWVAFGDTVRVVFLVALAVALLPSLVYRRFWPERLTPLRAAGWSAVAATVVAIELAALMVVVTRVLAPDAAVIVAFAAVVIGNYVVPSRLLD